MIRLIFISLAFFAMFPLHLLAAPLRIQSGEHANYSRLVVPIPPGGNWQVQHEGGTVTAAIQGHNDGYDSGTVFSFIPNTRIKALSSSAEQFTLSLGCACDVAAFETGRRYLVIDVADPGQTIQPPMLNARSAIAAPLPLSPPIETASAPRLEPLDLPRNLGQIPPRDSKKDPLSLPLRSALERQVLTEVQTQLTEDISRATTRGMLQPSEGGLPSKFDLSISPQTEELPLPAEEGAPSPLKTAEPPDNVHLRITSSMDLPNQPEDSPFRMQPESPPCLRNERLAFLSPLDEIEFAEHLRTARQNLFREFDRIDEKIAVDLVQNYLLFGFGAEARQVLALTNDLNIKRPELSEIALIFDHGHVPGESALAEQLDCDSDVALWAILATPQLREGSTANVDAALRALSKLPLHLRRFIAPELSNRFLSAGYNTAARTALRSVERSAEPVSPDGKLAGAQIDLAEGLSVAAETPLKEVVDANAPPSPKALVALVNNLIEQGKPVPSETALLVEAYAQELRDTPLGPDLHKAQFQSLVKSAQFDEAAKFLHDVGSFPTLPGKSEMFEFYFAELTENASDIVFMEHIFPQLDANIAKLSPRILMDIAERMFEIGFAGQAQIALQSVPDRPQNTPRQILEAQIAVALDQPRRALAALLFVDDPAAEPLRAKANQLAGNFSDAHDIYAELDAEQERQETAWLSDNWRNLLPPETPIFGPLANLPEPSPSPPPTGEGMLGHSSAALEDSSALRAAIDTMLSAPPLQIPAP
ncbi:MAG: hypothetical protein ACSHWZ_00975 [Sulfitobacter sp.]